MAKEKEIPKLSKGAGAVFIEQIDQLSGSPGNYSKLIQNFIDKSYTLGFVDEGRADLKEAETIVKEYNSLREIANRYSNGNRYLGETLDTCLKSLGINVRGD